MISLGVEEKRIEMEERIVGLKALKAELERMVQECAHGIVAECRVIEVLAYHDKCLHHDQIFGSGSVRA